ncbi:MAG: HPP family protein [Blastomonas fulva]|uniref:HPP family protein n=1 Tax=Blastomonas fulva TaxID=1550728 RepID=UPI004033C0F0
MSRSRGDFKSVNLDHLQVPKNAHAAAPQTPDRRFLSVQGACRFQALWKNSLGRKGQSCKGDAPSIRAKQVRSIFIPIMAGASLSDRLIACLGGTAGIALTALVTQSAMGASAAWVWLVAPMGASAVLIFAVPASPLAQPWSVIGGNVVSALVGVGVALIVPWPAIASGIAVGGAILAMSLLRCLHPPGGAAALTAVIGGPAVVSAGWLFPLFPVGLNAVILTATGILYHSISKHSYPHRPDRHATISMRDSDDQPFHPDDLDSALADLGETFDISPEDLGQLFNRVRYHAAKRRKV